MSLPAVLDLKIYTGDTFTRSMQFADEVDDDGNVTQPTDITGWTLAAQIRARPGAADIVASFVITITDAGQGTFDMELDAATTAEITASRAYVWDLEAQKPGDIVRTFLRGTVAVDRDVTEVAGA